MNDRDQAREELSTAIMEWAESTYEDAEDVTAAILEHLPLVLAAAEEAGLLLRDNLGVSWKAPSHDHGVYQLASKRRAGNRP